MSLLPPPSTHTDTKPTQPNPQILSLPQVKSQESKLKAHFSLSNIAFFQLPL